MKIKVFKVRVLDGFLAADEETVNSFLDRHEIVNMNAKFISDDNYWSIMVYYKLQCAKNSSNKVFVDSEDSLSDDQKIIYNELKIWRLRKAKELVVPSFYVCHNTHLMSIAKFSPNSLKEFSEIKGFGHVRTEKYGEEILDVLMNV